jgi:hypothetical protein
MRPSRAGQRRGRQPGLGRRGLHRLDILGLDAAGGVVRGRVAERGVHCRRLDRRQRRAIRGLLFHRGLVRYGLLGG